MVTVVACIQNLHAIDIEYGMVIIAVIQVELTSREIIIDLDFTPHPDISGLPKGLGINIVISSECSLTDFP